MLAMYVGMEAGEQGRKKKKKKDKTHELHINETCLFLAANLNKNKPPWIYFYLFLFTEKMPVSHCIVSYQVCSFVCAHLQRSESVVANSLSFFRKRRYLTYAQCLWPPHTGSAQPPNSQPLKLWVSYARIFCIEGAFLTFKA